MVVIGSFAGEEVKMKVKKEKRRKNASKKVNERKKDPSGIKHAAAKSWMKIDGQVVLLLPYSYLCIAKRMFL